MDKACGEPSTADQSTWNREDVDVLVPQSTEEYVEFTRVSNDPPDYVFQIPNISNWVTRVTSFAGRNFHLRNSPYQAKIHSVVRFSDISLSLVIHPPQTLPEPMFPSPDAEQVEENMHVQLAAVVKQSPPAANDIVLTGSVRTQRHRGCYQFSRFTFADRLKNPKDNLTIHLYAKNVWEKIPSRVLRWKVDCSNMDITDELGLTPPFYAHAQGFMVQTRLFLQDEQMTAEFLLLKGTNDERNKEKFSILLHLVNPVDRRLNLVRAVQFEEWYKPELEPETSTTCVIGMVESLKDFFVNNKLMVKVELVYEGKDEEQQR